MTQVTPPPPQLLCKGRTTRNTSCRHQGIRQHKMSVGCMLSPTPPFLVGGRDSETLHMLNRAKGMGSPAAVWAADIAEPWAACSPARSWQSFEHKVY